MAPRMVAALFVRADSIYKRMPGVDPWDIDRNAMDFPMACPVVAHPPCRLWGALRQFSTALASEKALAPWAVEVVRKCGGVLEHPITSRLWHLPGMPPCQVDPLSWNRRYMDAFGGWYLDIDQFDFGHLAAKRTRFYICGIERRFVVIPWSTGAKPNHVVTNGYDIRKGDQRWRKEITKSDRERTPPMLAQWLINLARKCEVQKKELIL